ncbi:hypothetical protein [Parafilimonas sp.]|uniref:hypothetical protein n=1 Tax=Parafilimonas sp. TaxID=1969739 RepID=UPI0039E21E86
MLTDFAKELHNLSDKEIEQYELALKKEKASRRINEILEAAKEARKEHDEGKTYVASTPEEIIQWFKDVMDEES